MQNHGVETKFEKIVLPEIPLNITMIGNEKFEPFTLWNDIELIHRINASQWTS